LDQASIFDAVSEAMLDHWVIPVDESRQVVVFPDEKPLIAFFWGLQVKAESGIIAFILNAGETSASTAKTHAAGFPQADPVERLIGTAGKPLREHGVQVVSQPTHPQRFACLVQGVLRKVVLFPQVRKRCLSFLFLRAWDGTGSPAWAGSARIARSRFKPRESTAL
jgi:hypothetical protein